MMYARSLCSALLIGCYLWVASGPVLAQAKVDAKATADEEIIEVIISQPDSATEPRRSLRNFFKAIKRRVASITVHALPLTKGEKWRVRKKDLARVRREAARQGVFVTEVGADWNHVFQSASTDMMLSARQRSMIELAKASKATTAVKIMAGPPPAKLEYALTKDADATPGSKEPAKITVALSDNTVLTIVRTSVDIKHDMCIWRGRTEQTGALVTLLWWPNGTMSGTLQQQNQRLYSIRHLGGRLYAIVEMNGDRMPREHAAMPARLRSNDPSLRDDPLIQQGDASILRPVTAGIRTPATPRPEATKNKAMPPPIQKVGTQSKNVVIDVIVAYTKKAARNYADVKRELVDLSIEEANESFRLSNLGHVKLRLVHAYQTDYVEEGTHFDHVWRFADKGDSSMDEIHGLRDKHRADVAILLVDGPNGCGLATRVYADAEEAFAVVHHECAATSYTVAHEIGHLIGARHNLEFDKIMAPFPYGHGYVNGTKWRDIMSYKESCGGCPRVPVWSSPKVQVKGEPAGTPQLDNARVIAEQAARVAAFR
jgi:Metallo-peptidase family M12